VISHTYICRICGHRSEKPHRVDSACATCRELYDIGDCEPNPMDQVFALFSIIIKLAVICFSVYGFYSVFWGLY